MCTKSQKDGQNHKNTGVRRAIFHKRPSRRARPSIDGRLGNTANANLKIISHLHHNCIDCILGASLSCAFSCVFVNFDLEGVCVCGNPMENPKVKTKVRDPPNLIPGIDISSRAGDLRKHLTTHSGEKPSKCNQCDYASSRAGNLRKHLKTHRRENPQECDYAAIMHQLGFL